MLPVRIPVVVSSRSATRIARVCACDKTRREAEANVDVFAAAAAPPPPVCFGADAAPLSPRELAPPRRRRRDQPRSSSERCRAATDMTVGDGVFSQYTTPKGGRRLEQHLPSSEIPVWWRRADLPRVVRFL